MINIREATVVGIVTLLAIGAVFDSFYTVDQGDRAVLLRNGAIVGVEQPGLHFKTPWIDVVHQVDVQTRTQRYAKVNSYSQDQQPADIAISVTYHVDPGMRGVVGVVPAPISSGLREEAWPTFV